jgi:alcohol dehydrogenase YqhD (iron-dependent ADH family)
MTEAIIVAILALIGTLGGTFGGILTANKLTNYRIEQLEKKVEKHNNVIERVYKLEKDEAVIQEEIEHLQEYHKH